MSLAPSAPQNAALRPMPLSEWISSAGGGGLQAKTALDARRNVDVRPWPLQAPAPSEVPRAAPERRTEPVPQREPCRVCERTLREAEDERAMLVERLQAPYIDAAEQLARTAAELESRYSHDVLQLAAMLAEQIVGRTVELDPEVVLLGLERALSAVGPVSTAVIHCSPGDADIIATKARELPSLRGRTIDLRIEPRQELPSGGVTVEFSDGSADARLATQLDELVRTVEKAVLDPQRAGSRR